MKLRARVGDDTLDLDVEKAGQESKAWTVRIDGAVHVVDLQRIQGDTWSLLLDAASHELSLIRQPEGWVVGGADLQAVVRFEDPDRVEAPARRHASGTEHVTATMPGRVARVLVSPGQAVAHAQGLLVVEAMKMENEIASPRPGTIRAVRVSPGQTVERGAVLVELD